VCMIIGVICAELLCLLLIYIITDYILIITADGCGIFTFNLITICVDLHTHARVLWDRWIFSCVLYGSSHRQQLISYP
jgi:hypothetical protein